MRLALGPTLYDLSDPMGKMFFNILANFAEFEADLIRMCTREGMVMLFFRDYRPVDQEIFRVFLSDFQGH